MTERLKLSTWWIKYRIYPDCYKGYEVRCWRIYWPFWIMLCHEDMLCNTFSNKEDAYNLAKIHRFPKEEVLQDL